ncbi:alanine racemase [soil metagenome]
MADARDGGSIDARLAAAGLPPLPRRAWLEIDEQALAGNLALARELAGAGVELNAVVKADAYGHGLVSVARVFERAGADRLCVASLDEALVLRRAGISAPILVLFAIPPAEAVAAARQRIEIVAAERTSTLATLAAWQAGSAGGAQLSVHLEIETGLSRGGFQPSQAGAMAHRIGALSGVKLAGIWSHLATPDDEDVTAAQVDAFERAVDAVRATGIDVPARHLGATGGLYTGRAPAYEGVRVGLALYGLLPDDLPLSARATDAAAGLRPALALKCLPLRIETLAAGTPVGYGGRWVTERESRIATLPIGYGDGWARASSPVAGALVRGRRVALVGTVAMDALMADVTDVPEVGMEDEFVLIGEQEGARITADEVAGERRTINYEVTTALRERLPRVHFGGG